MKGCLLDTNAASALWDALHPDHGRVRNYLNEIEDETPIFISPIVFGEITYGYEIHVSADEERKRAIRSKLREFKPSQILAITEHTAEVYGELRARLFQKFAPRSFKGKVMTKWPEDLVDRTTAKELGIQENDLWLAAQAIERNLVLVTNDKMNRIRGAIPELQVKVLRN